ncbi:sensor domain-containing diguanylate cyclase [Pseudoalteromonas sp. P94(2023)]|uniref:diguanylate cyclase n=1 Tax=Pseudoalteromonas obscura TaxID=3048491 RepID=A0ABT7ELH8_9GAMM|nr:sensor domain-containing diguanylate cyclase [Pseudoalteromonas sp. P94(2023)]
MAVNVKEYDGNVSNNRHNELTHVTQRLRRVLSKEVDVSVGHQQFLSDIILEAKALLNVSRVSVWLFDDVTNPEKLVNFANTDWEGVITGPLPELTVLDYPNYFRAIVNGETISACDAITDPRTKEFTEGYLIPQQICALLDTAIFQNGLAIGVVCCEGRFEPRDWLQWEVVAAELIADCCSRRLLVHELWQMQQRLTEMAFQDVLTGLKNRRYLMDYARSEMSRHQRSDRPLSLLMIDLDRFKLINDEYGHDGGDEVLKQFARCCNELVRTEDCVCRLGGEEFIILLPETEVAKAMNVAQRLREEAAGLTVQYEGKAIRFTVSIGVADVNLHMPFSQSLKAADQAVYQAKAAGRDQIKLAL